MNNRDGLLVGLVLLGAGAGASGCAGNAARAGTGSADAAADGTTNNGDGAPGAITDNGDGAPGTLDAAAGDGGVGAPTGSPCTPEQELNPTFNGFVFQEVSFEPNLQCQSHLCLVNHFQGRVSCPYGQQADGTPLPGTASCTPNGDSGCCTPGTDLPVTGAMAVGPRVSPQCLDRTSDETVYCSCQCAIPGASGGDTNYCTCPAGFACTLLTSPLGASSGGAAYCVKDGTQYDASPGSCDGTCDPSLKNCGDVQGVP